MRKFLLLAAGIGVAMMVRRRAAEQGIAPAAVVSNAFEQAMAWLTGFPERLPNKEKAS
jgi:hypothetical protein